MPLICMTSIYSGLLYSYDSIPCNLIFCPSKLFIINLQILLKQTYSAFDTRSAFILFADSTTIKKMNMDGTNVETIYSSGGFLILDLDYHYRLVGHVGFAYACKRTQIRKS